MYLSRHELETISHLSPAADVAAHGGDGLLHSLPGAAVAGRGWLVQ